MGVDILSKHNIGNKAFQILPIVTKMTRILVVHDSKDFKQEKSKIDIHFSLLLIINDWQLYGKWIIFLNNLRFRGISRKFVEKNAADLFKVVQGFLIQPVSFVLLIFLAARFIMKGLTLNSIFLHVSTRSSLYAETCKFLEVSVKEQGILKNEIYSEYWGLY